MKNPQPALPSANPVSANPHLFRLPKPTSKPEFQERLRAILADSELLADKTLSLFFQTSNRCADEIFEPVHVKTSHFLVEICRQTWALRQQIKSETWTAAAPNLPFLTVGWQLPPASANPLDGLRAVLQTTDSLAARYENLLTTALQGSDRGAAFYLIASHLGELMTHLHGFEQLLASGSEPPTPLQNRGKKFRP